ncbi:dimethylhistidine N-methyltransferase [Dyadobacter sp. SG02]|uniref:L-histidine N(alpha)-methyltransferase n=1 Tax=Dyadobacter sp. SG02 TaxID=1855291 RepID=UPI0008B61788|nr:L-histidine N(alpha)-methyltransferase [Dyadobacter sp. SG02]SEI50447.1 dimethylhistidine N-methyltransferase [Dyadobacter sp. SG02]
MFIPDQFIGSVEVAPTSDKTTRPDILNFYVDVLRGLSARQKHISSKYFYDAQGDRIFQQIMACQGYYPFKCELEIFQNNSDELAQQLIGDGSDTDLIELGSGDAQKSIYLLQALSRLQACYTYVPIDISGSMVAYLTGNLGNMVPHIRVSGLVGEYLPMLQKAARRSTIRKTVMMLGSNLGNMLPVDALKLCERIRALLNAGDRFVVGIDLKKSPQQVLAAYNDKQGITRRFNLNLLARLNRELNADFNLDQFEHFPTYDPESGSCKSYLISLQEQAVTFRLQDRTDYIYFQKHETIFTEISQKYNIAELEKMAKIAGFEVIQNYYDANGWFVDMVWEAKQM